MEKLSQCPVCMEGKFNAFLQVKDNVVSHETFTINACEKCGFKFTNPRPDEQEIGRYYESEEYIYHSNKKKGIFLSAFHFVRDIAIRNKLKWINTLTPGNSKSMLDYGCGTGEFLSACKRNGWQTKGVETSPSARKHAIEKFGLDVEDLPAFSSLPKNSYDIITLWHVLEHVHRLDEALATLASLLKTNGHLLIAVPNCSSLDAAHYGANWAAYDPPRHLYHFTPKDMDALLDKHGMKVVKHIPLPFDAFYVSLLSERFKSGKMNYLFGLLTGLRSNWSKGKDSKKCSSITYLISKK